MTDTPTLRTLSSATVDLMYTAEKPQITEVSVPNTGPFKQFLTVTEGSYTSHDMRGLAVTSGVMTHHTGNMDEWVFGDESVGWLTPEGHQVFEGTLCGRQGAFAWHEKAIKEGNRVNASCVIIEGSGTGELVGITGRGVFALPHNSATGQPSPGTLIVELQEV